MIIDQILNSYYKITQLLYTQTRHQILDNKINNSCIQHTSTSTTTTTTTTTTTATAAAMATATAKRQRQRQPQQKNMPLG
jgi:hypothetical protein